jgi:hypothetical protein
MTMPKSRWRLPAAGATVVVGAAIGVITNLITSRWSIGLGVGLGVLLVLGVILQVALAIGNDAAEAVDGDAGRVLPSVRQVARARGHATIIQAGGDVTRGAGDGISSPADGKGPAE